MKLRSLFFQVQKLLGNGVFSLKTRSEFLEVLEKHGESCAVDTREAPVDRGFFRIGFADGEQKGKA
jgi:hypothetical protein